MRLKNQQQESRGNRGNQIGVEVTSQINIYNLKVTLVTSVTSIFFFTCEGARNIGTIYLYLTELPRVWKNEVTEVTEVTRSLLPTVFWLPLSRKSYLCYPKARPLYE